VLHLSIIIKLKDLDNIGMARSLPNIDFLLNRAQLVRQLAHSSYWVYCAAFLLFQHHFVVYLYRHFLDSFHRLFFTWNFSENFASCMSYTAKCTFAKFLFDCQIITINTFPYLIRLMRREIKTYVSLN